MDPEHKIFVGNIPGTVKGNKNTTDMNSYYTLSEWEELIEDCSTGSNYKEITYRAKVFAGWLIRHKTMSDYQYECHEHCVINHNHILDEGYQHVTNTLTVIPDKHHKWKIK